MVELGWREHIVQLLRSPVLHTQNQMRVGFHCKDYAKLLWYGLLMIAYFKKKYL
jgi:hypothetical protein